MNMIHIFKWLFGLAIMLSVGELAGQSQRIVFSDIRMETEAAMRAVEQQTGLTFSYNSQFDDLSSTIVFSDTELSLEQAMTQMLDGKSLNFMFRKRYIIIYPDRSKNNGSASVVRNRTFDTYERTPENSRNAGPQRRQVVDTPAPSAPVVRRVVAPIPDTSAFYSSYRSLERFVRRDSYLPVLAVKTNLLYAAGTFTPNLAIEMGINAKMSIALSGSYNPWNRIGTLDNNDKLVHWVVRPELRYWFCERFNGHFVSAGPFYNQFNISGYDIPFVGFEKAWRYEGYAFGAGVNYGYSLPVTSRLNVEFSAGVGVAWMKYDRFECSLCSGVLAANKKTYFGPTNFAINLVYLIR
jgi:hypothetical protein